ncbi:MAG: hypothetical protein ACM3OO_00690 [Planctomycetaceae bacterium]
MAVDVDPGAASSPTAPGDGGRERPFLDLALLGGVAGVVTVIFLWPTIWHSLMVPLGPDVPVYLWWARVAGGDGISLVGARPASAALIPTLGGALGFGTVQALAGLQYALGPAIALSAAAVLLPRRGRPHAAWIVGGLLAGVWATHLGDGYVANLAFVAPYLAAAAALARRTGRGTVAAAVLLAGGGLAHPQFFAVGAVILGIVAVLSVIAERGFAWRSDAGRVLAALGGGTLGVVAGLLAALIGPARLGGDTSKDAFLRRVGYTTALRTTYEGRFRDNWRHYAPIMNTGLAVAGIFQGRAFARRFLVGWAAFTAVAVPLGILTAWYPPDRVLTFAFCIPLLAALGLVWLDRKLKRWWLAWPAALVLIVLTSLPTLRGWNQQGPFISPEELQHATLAGRIAATTPPGTPLVFVVDDPASSGLFLLSHSLNVARAAVPPDRAGDVHVYLGTPQALLAGRPVARGERLYDIASITSLRDLPASPAPAVFVVSEFDRDPGAVASSGLTRWDPNVASTVADPRPLPAAPGEIGASTPGAIVVATIATLVLLFVIGFGWGWWAMGDVAGGAAIAPAFGVAVLALSSLLLERLGAGLGGRGVATLASALGGGCGYALLVIRRHRDREDGGGRLLVLEGEAHVDP